MILDNRSSQDLGIFFDKILEKIFDGGIQTVLALFSNLQPEDCFLRAPLLHSNNAHFSLQFLRPALFLKWSSLLSHDLLGIVYQLVVIYRKLVHTFGKGEKYVETFYLAHLRG